VVTICTAQWSLYVPHSGHYMYRQFNIKKFYVLPTQCIYVFCVDLRKTAIISLYNINWLFFITETECVYCAVRTGYLTAVQFDSPPNQPTNQTTAYLKQPDSLFTLHLKREEQQFLNSSLSARNKQMFTKGFLFVLKDSQSGMKFLKGFSCSQIVCHVHG